MTADNPDEFEYDVALSFAGEDRLIAEQFADLLRSKRIKVFYDEYEAAQLWGKDLIDHLVNIYSRKARYCVIFISKHYPLKKWTKVERMAAQERSFRDANEYILPLRLDDAQVPGITETTGYRDLRQHRIEDVATLLEQKLQNVKSRSGTLPHSHDLRSGTVASAKSMFPDIPLPKRKKTFTQLEKDRFARDSYHFIRQYFQAALNQLQNADPDIQTDIEDVTNLKFTSRIYVHGSLKTQCNIWLGDTLMPNTIHYSEGTRRIDNSVNDYLPVEENGEELRLHIGHFGIGMHIEEPLATQPQAAEYLWRRFTAYLQY